MKNRSKMIAVMAVAVLLVAGWAAVKPDNKSVTPPSGQTSGQTQTTTPSTQPSASSQTSVETADFKYSKPIGWAKISQKTLDSTGAASGIGRPTEPVATFSVKVSNAVPKDTNDLKNSTLYDIKKNAPHFALLSSVSTKINSHASQMFTYTFTDTDSKNKIRQQLSATPYKGKTFFLLASAMDYDFDKQTGEFNKILASFHFK